MILRAAQPAPVQSAIAQPAWPTFEKTQKDVALPCWLVPQPAHAALAGALACRLEPEIFGVLPPDILEAIRLHDIGWTEADNEQIQYLQQNAAARPLSFTEIAPAISTVAWRRSIRHAETISAAAQITVSRHFCSLAMDDEAHHRAFLDEESERRRPVEERFGNEADLTRWLGALGFCDLLSLSLCSGHHAPVHIPLAHPNMPGAKEAPWVTVECRESEFQISPRTLEAGEAFQAEAHFQVLPAQSGAAAMLRWLLVTEWGRETKPSSEQELVE